MMHLFRECFYICKKTRSSEWKEDKKIRDEFRIKLKEKSYSWKTVNKMTDTNISKDIDQSNVE
jgi:hypothetical protein